MLNKTGPKTEPWGTPLATGCQLDLRDENNECLEKQIVSISSWICRP